MERLEDWYFCREEILNDSSLWITYCACFNVYRLWGKHPFRLNKTYKIQTEWNIFLTLHSIKRFGASNAEPLLYYYSTVVAVAAAAVFLCGYFLGIIIALSAAKTCIEWDFSFKFDFPLCVCVLFFSVSFSLSLDILHVRCVSWNVNAGPVPKFHFESIYYSS